MTDEGHPNRDGATMDDGTAPIAELQSELERVDAADAPDVAEHIAQRLSEDLSEGPSEDRSDDVSDGGDDTAPDDGGDAS